jgi:type-F conjugative transfer system pilin assembly protein TrbC
MSLRVKCIKGALTLGLLSAGVLCSFSVHANLNTQISSIQMHAQSAQQNYHVDSQQLLRMVRASNNFHQGLNYANRTQSHNPKGAATGVMVFVSLSMPDRLLREILISAHQYHIPVIVRGLVHNDMRATLARMFAIIHPKGTTTAIKGGFEINPLWFRAFDIKAVPAVVAIQGGDNCYGNAPCPSRTFDVIYGNITLHDALKEIAKHGQAALVAKAYLEQGGAHHD